MKERMKQQLERAAEELAWRKERRALVEDMKRLAAEERKEAKRQGN